MGLAPVKKLISKRREERPMFSQCKQSVSTNAALDAAQAGNVLRVLVRGVQGCPASGPFVAWLFQADATEICSFMNNVRLLAG